jgi:hypothetical protein
MTKPKMRRAAGTSAWARDRDAAPNVRNTIDMVNVVTIEKSQKMKKAPGSRLRLDKK